MNNITQIGYEDFKLLYEYLSEFCKEKNIKIKITPSNNLEVETENELDEEIKITVYKLYTQDTATRFPTIRREATLSSYIKRRKTQRND